MSELVEKVAREICVEKSSLMLNKTQIDKRWRNHVPEARAAIIAIAEWINGTGYVESEYWADILKSRLKKS